MINDDFNIGIIGAGKLGSILAFHSLKFNKLQWILARNDKSRNALIENNIPPNLILDDLNSETKLPDVIIISVNDENIENLNQKLADLYNSKLLGRIIFHCSGVLSKECLLLLKSFGSSIASCHPYQTFYTNRDELLKNVPWGIDCAEDEFYKFQSIIEFFEGNPIKLTDETLSKKALYHAAAVATSNFLISTIELAKLIALEAGIEPKIFIRKLAETSLQNALDSIDSESELPLTGPIARGDINAVQLHLSAMKDLGIHEIFKSFALGNLEIADFNNKINLEKYNTLKKLLSSI